MKLIILLGVCFPHTLAIFPNCNDISYQWREICGILGELQEADPNFRISMQQIVPTTDAPNLPSNQPFQCEAGPSTSTLPENLNAALPHWEDLKKLVLGLVQYKHELEILRHQTEYAALLERAVMVNDLCPAILLLQTRSQAQQQIIDNLTRVSTSIVDQLQRVVHELLEGMTKLKTDSRECQSVESDELRGISQHSSIQDTLNTLTRSIEDLRRQNSITQTTMRNIQEDLNELLLSLSQMRGQMPH